MISGSPAPERTPPSEEEPDIAGIVLAGGSSRRMGRDKAILRAPGPPDESMLARAVRRLAEADAGSVVVATGTPGRLGLLPWPEVGDGPFAGQGPLAGMTAAMTALAARRVDVAIVLAVDLPDASPPLLRWLVHELLVTGVPGLIPLDPAEGRPQPLHAVYRPSIVAAPLAAELAAGNLRVLRALAVAGAVQVQPPDGLQRATPTWHRNLNTPLDLRGE